MADTEWRKVSRLYRRPLGRAWLIGLVLVPLLLALIGYGMLDRTRSQEFGGLGPGGALPSPVEPAAPVVTPAVPPALALAPLAIIRHGSDITLEGNLPDTTAKRVLLDLVLASAGDDANVIDNLGIDPSIRALDFSTAGPVFDAAAMITDFTLAVNGDSVTISGTAAKPDAADAVVNAAEDAWPNVNIVNKLEIASLVTPTVAPGSGG